MKDKVAFVTGGGSGIGRACALALAAQGARVVVVGRTLAKCDAVVAEIGGASALAVQADIASSADVQRAIAQTVAHFGGLDVLVNSAGISPSGRITEINQAIIDDPALVNRDSAGEGWFFKLALADTAAFDALLDEDAYNAFLETL